MKHVAFYGASDDLIEVDGDIHGVPEEFPGEVARFQLCGLIVQVKLKNSGCWGIAVWQLDEDIPVRAENIILTPQPNLSADGSYSMRLDMDVPDDTVLAKIEIPDEQGSR